MTDSAEISLGLAASNPDDFSFSANEGSSVDIDLEKLVKNPSKQPLKFSAELALGGDLPTGLVCSPEGKITGTPAPKTAEVLPYDILIITETPNQPPLVFDIYLTILSTEKRGIVLPTTDEELVETIHSDAIDKTYGVDIRKIEKYWELFASDGQLPDLERLLTRQVTPEDIYYLLERFATLTIWDADNLSPADEGKVLALAGSSPYYQVYDFGVALVATPKELYDTHRVLSDAFQTARVMIQEVQKRGWKIQLSGYDKMITAAWVEVNRLNEANPEQKIEIEDFTPSAADLEILSYSLGRKIE